MTFIMRQMALFYNIAVINCAGQVFKTILIEFEKEKKTKKKKTDGQVKPGHSFIMLKVRSHF